MINISQENKKTLSIGGKKYVYYDITSLDKLGLDVSRLPYSIKALSEGALRNQDGKSVTEDHIKRIASLGWKRYR